MNKIIIFLGPSGAGKSTLEKKVFTRDPERFRRVVSATTRMKRQGEEHGKDYHFLSLEEFDLTPMAERDGIDQNFYGTPQSELKTAKDLLLSMEPNGAKKILEYLKNHHPEKTAYIVYFSIPADKRHENMAIRGDEAEKIKKRIENDDIEERWIKSGLVADLEIQQLSDDLDEKVLKLIDSELN